MNVARRVARGLGRFAARVRRYRDRYDYWARHSPFAATVPVTYRRPRTRPCAVFATARGRFSSPLPRRPAHLLTLKLELRRSTARLLLPITT